MENGYHLSVLGKRCLCIIVDRHDFHRNSRTTSRLMKPVSRSILGLPPVADKNRQPCYGCSRFRERKRFDKTEVWRAKFQHQRRCLECKARDGKYIGALFCGHIEKMINVKNINTLLSESSKPQRSMAKAAGPSATDRRSALQRFSSVSSLVDASSATARI